MRDEYPPLLESLPHVFWLLLKSNLVSLPEPHNDWSPRLDHTKYCHYHRGPCHNTESYHSFRDLVYDWNDLGYIDWKKIRKGIEYHFPSKPTQTQPQTNRDLVQSSLTPPNHQSVSTHP